MVCIWHGNIPRFPLETTIIGAIERQVLVWLISKFPRENDNNNYRNKIRILVCTISNFSRSFAERRTKKNHTRTVWLGQVLVCFLEHDDRVGATRGGFRSLENRENGFITPLTAQKGVMIQLCRNQPYVMIHLFSSSFKQHTQLIFSFLQSRSKLW